jgi:hypothetical protein
VSKRAPRQAFVFVEIPAPILLWKKEKLGGDGDGEVVQPTVTGSFNLTAAATTSSSMLRQLRRPSHLLGRGSKVRFDVVNNRGKHSAENPRIA